MTAPVLERTAWRAEVGDAVAALSWRGTADLLAVADLAGDVTLLDGRTGSTVARTNEHPGGVFALAWQPGGELLATAGADGRVGLHDAKVNDPTHVQLGGWVNALAWSRDGRQLAVAAGRSVVLLDPAGAVLRRWEDHPSTVTDVVWSRDGSRLGAAAYGGLRWYAVGSESTEPVRVFDWRGSLLRARVSPDGRWVASGNQDASVHIWRLWSGEDAEMTGYPQKVDALAFDRTSRWMANGGTDEISLWDFSGRGPMGRTPRMLPGHDAQVSALAWQPTGGVLASAGRDGGLALWEPGLKGRRTDPRRRLDLGGWATTLAWSPDGACVVAGTVDGALVAVQP